MAEQFKMISAAHVTERSARKTRKGKPLLVRLLPVQLSCQALNVAQGSRLLLSRPRHVVGCVDPLEQTKLAQRAVHDASTAARRESKAKRKDGELVLEHMLWVQACQVFCAMHQSSWSHA